MRECLPTNAFQALRIHRMMVPQSRVELETFGLRIQILTLGWCPETLVYQRFYRIQVTMLFRQMAHKMAF